MSIVRYDAVTSAYESVGVEMTSASTLNISLTDSYGRAITGFEVQGLSIIFEPDTVEAGDTITIYVSDRSGNYEDAEPVTVQLDSNRLGSATISMVQKGGFTLSSLSGPEAVMTVVDSNGNTVLSKTASVSGSITGLDSGNYTAILIEKSSLMRSAPSESYLDSLGLVAGVDYLKVEFTVSSGVITELGDLVVPDFDESKLSYTTSSSVTLSKASGMTVGSSFTLRVAYELDTSKATGASTISVVFPDGVSPISQIAAIDSDFVTFTYSDGVATVDVSGKESSAVTFFCVAGTTAGTYNINASLNLSDGAIQPLGTARAVVETASISAPDRTSTESITVSGCTLPNSAVTVYDNGTLVAETTSNSVGSWSTTLTLAGKLYSYSYHYIYAETVSEAYGETVLSDEVLVVYSEVSVEVQKITMYTSTKTLEFDLTSDSTVVPYYSYMDDDADYTFTVQVSPESVALIEDLYVYTVDAYGDETYVELQYDATTGLWAGNHEYSDPNTIPVAIGAAYNCSDEYYMIPEDDEELLQDLSESSAAVYDAVTDYWNEIIDNNIEEVYDEDTGIVSVYYVDTDTEEETLMFTYVHYYSELTNEFTAEYLEESGFCAIDDDENCWVYAEEYGEDYLESYVTCVVDMDAAEIHVISYDYSNLYEEETPVVYSTRSSVSEDTTYLLKANGEFNLLTSATSSQLSAPNTTTQYKIPETITDNITTWDRTKDTFTTMDGIAFGTASDGLAAVAKDAADQMDLPRQFASSGLARTFQILSGLTAVASQASTIDEFNKIQSNLATRISILYDEADKAYSLALAKCDDGTTYKLTKEQIEATANAVSAIRDQISLIQYAKWENLLGATAINLLGCVPGIGTALSFASAGLHVIATGSFQNAYVQQIEKEYVRSCNEFNEIHKSINTLINGIKSNYQDCDDDDEPEPEPEEQTPYLPVRAIQDPSGYVYEAVPSNTLEGVTAVISYNNNGTAIEWDAEAYSQANPQVTDESGTFQWDVPTGEWIVSFTKDGYYSTDTSDSANANDDGWLPVPPPQVNIAVAMVSTASPTVESVIAYTDRIEIVFSQYMDMSDSDTASVLNSISVTRDGTVVDVIVTALDAEYDLEGTTQYATRLAVVPSDGVITDGMVVTVDGSAENYAGTPIGADYVSDALTVQVRPTEISSDDSVEAVMHETTSIEVALMPAISGTTLTVESSSEDIVSVTTASVTTDANGIATLQIEGQLPGAGVITVTEPISGVSTTIDISVVWVASNVAVEPVVATLDDGTVLTSGMTIPAGSVVTLSTTTSGATIRYTVNDTCPKKDAALYYSEPIVIDEDTVLRAAAYLDGTYSSTIRLELTVDDGSCSHVSGEAVQENIVNATCTTDGSYDSVVYCTVCGEELSRETITVPATGHTEGESVTENEVAATCTADSSYDSVVYCTVCGEELSRETITVPATGHTEGESVTENEVAATCTTDGSYDSVVYCTVCGEELSRETITVPATGHIEGESVTENEVAATCTADGSYDSVICCTVCNEELLRETVTVPATGHTEAEAVVENEVAATCTTDGSYDSVVYCSICHEELSRETIVVPAAHTTGTAVRENVVEATRTTEGSYDLVTYCTVCGEEISRETVTVPATGVDMVTVWLRTPADYSAVNNAIAKANALDSGDYTNFSDVTDAINAVNWTYNALMQSYVNEMAEKIETAIANLIPVGTTTEEVEIQEPIEDTNTDTEDDDAEPSETSEPETNPTTGIAISLLPMMIVALAAVSAKRR